MTEVGGRKHTNKTQSQNAGFQAAEEMSASADGNNKSRTVPKSAVSGTENFGLANPTIAHLISQLPHVDEITVPKGVYNPNSQELKGKGRGKRKSMPDESSPALDLKVRQRDIAYIDGLLYKVGFLKIKDKKKERDC